MGKDKIEDIIKNRLLGHREHIDKDELLTSMGLLDEEPKKRRFVFWLFPVFIGAFVSVYYLVNFNSNKIESSASTNSEMASNKIEKQKENIQLTKNLSTTLPQLNESNISQNINKTELVNQKSNNPNQDTRDDVNLSTSGRHIKAKFPLNNQNNHVNNIDAKLIDQNVKQQTVVSTKRESINYKKEIVNFNRITRVVLLIDTIPFIQYKTIPYISLALFDWKKQEPDSYRAEEWSVIPTIGFSKFYRSLEAKENSSSDYMSLRKEEEKELEQIDFGIAFKYKFSKLSYVKFGVELISYNSQLSDINYKAYSTSDSVFVKDIVINLQGDTSYMERKVIVDGFTKEENIYYNNLMLANIPVSIGFEKTRGKWCYSAEGVISLNVYSKFIGKLKDQNKKLLSNPDFYRSGVNLFVGSSVGVGYSLSPKSKILLNANFKTSLGSLTNKKYELKERYSNYGLSLGVELRLE